ncbi:MAG: hypothetical protein ABW061_14030 [Polyangiaceae bacterium]
MNRFAGLRTSLLVAAVVSGLVASCSKPESTPSEAVKAPGPAKTVESGTTLAQATAAASKAVVAGSPAACFACENDPAKCKEFVACDSVAGEAAPGSPAAGTPKAKLCNEVLDCVRSSGCAAGNGIIKCYCGTADAQQCQDGHANGVCKKQLERGLEATTFMQIARHLKDPKFGGGLAMARIDCDQQVCRAQCNLQ